jgi:hypothetical protein
LGHAVQVLGHELDRIGFASLQRRLQVGYVAFNNAQALWMSLSLIAVT